MQTKRKRRHQLISKAELALLLSVNVWTIDRWRATRRDFPKPLEITPGATLRWRAREIEDWLNARERA